MCESVFIRKCVSYSDAVYCLFIEKLKMCFELSSETVCAEMSRRNDAGRGDDYVKSEIRWWLEERRCWIFMAFVKEFDILLTFAKTVINVL